MPIVVPGTGPLASTMGGTVGVTSLGVATQVTTRPGFLVAAVTETAWPYTVDVSNYLSGTDTISNPSVTLILASTGAILSSAWLISTTIIGNVITTIMDISKLQLGQSYQIVTTFTASAIKQPTFTTIIEVVA